MGKRRQLREQSRTFHIIRLDTGRPVRQTFSRSPRAPKIWTHNKIRGTVFRKEKKVNWKLLKLLIWGINQHTSHLARSDGALLASSTSTSQSKFVDWRKLRPTFHNGNRPKSIFRIRILSSWHINKCFLNKIGCVNFYWSVTTWSK